MGAKSETGHLQTTQLQSKGLETIERATKDHHDLIYVSISNISDLFLSISLSLSPSVSLSRAISKCLSISIAISISLSISLSLPTGAPASGLSSPGLALAARVPGGRLALRRCARRLRESEATLYVVWYRYRVVSSYVCIHRYGYRVDVGVDADVDVDVDVDVEVDMDVHVDVDVAAGSSVLGFVNYLCAPFGGARELGGVDLDITRAATQSRNSRNASSATYLERGFMGRSRKCCPTG